MLKKVFRQFAIYFLPLTFLTYLYLYPGSQLMITKSQSMTMSDGTDPLTLPFQYSIFANYFETNPRLLLYGAIPTHQFNAPEGMALWTPIQERIFGILGYYLFGAEQAGTFVAFCMLLASALSVVVLMRLLNFNYNISMATAIAVSFTAFSRARAVVHLGFLSLYSLPLIFIAIHLLKKPTSKKNVALSSFCLLLAGITCHYYLFIFAFAAPVFFIYLLWGESKKINQVLKLVIASVPVVVLMGFSILKATPSDYPLGHSAVPESGKTNSGETHSFVERFRAYPVDFLTGELKISPSDINPVKQKINQYVLESLTPKTMQDLYYISNTHERTNGIRWVILIPFLILPFFIFRKKITPSPEEKGLLICLYTLAIVGFLLACNLGLAEILHSIINQFRVTNRAGILVSFSSCIASAYLFKYFFQKKFNTGRLGKILNFPLFLSALMIIELPPLYNDITTAPVLPIANLPARNCGNGFYFPYVNGYFNSVETYGVYQTLRGTDCALVNDSQESIRESALFQKFGLNNNVIASINENSISLKSDLSVFLKCTNLDWIKFNPQMPEAWIVDTCKISGWTIQSGNVCINPNSPKNLPLGKIEACLQIK